MFCLYFETKLIPVQADPNTISFFSQPGLGDHFVSLGDYVPVDANELGFAEGDVLEILRVGTNGWWYAKHLSNYEEGWVPSTYLEPAAHRISPSISSSGEKRLPVLISYNTMIYLLGVITPNR